MAYLFLQIMFNKQAFKKSEMKFPSVVFSECSLHQKAHFQQGGKCLDGNGLYYSRLEGKCCQIDDRKDSHPHNDLHGDVKIGMSTKEIS